MTTITSRIPDPIRVASRVITAGDVVPFKHKQNKPFVTIKGRKFVLSTNSGFIAGDLLEEVLQDPRVVRGPSDPWKFLWVLDVDRKTLAMWRVSDGNEKYSSTIGSAGSLIPMLDRKGELNRVDGSTFKLIEREMRDREEQTLQSLRESIKESETDFQKQVNGLVETYFQKEVLPVLTRKLRDTERGVIPIGFKFDPDGFSKERQLKSFVVSQVWNTLFNPDAVEPEIAKKMDLQQGDSQAVYWAVHETWDDYVSKVLR